jgi:predicted protein tyrosine phosphatase
VPSPFKTTICGIDELTGHSDARVTHVLSILDPGTPEPDAFGRFGEHQRLELRFHDVIESRVPGYDPPQRHHIEAMLGFGRDMMRGPVEPVHLLVHCHMGISRSTAAAILLMAEAEPERPPAAIVDQVAAIRPKAWPNLRMIEIGDQLLGLEGALVEAVRERHRQMAEAMPHIIAFMRDSGRGRELD